MVRRSTAVLLVGISVAAGTASAKPKVKLGAVHPVAGFEQTLEAEEVEAAHARARLVEGGKERPGKVLRAQIRSGAEWARVVLARVPVDVRPMRLLRFWLKGDGEPAHEIHIRIYDRRDNYMVYRIDAPEAKWVQHEVRLGRLPTGRAFQPADVERVTLVWFDPEKPFTIELDDVAFVEGEGGWRLTHKEQAAHIFGEKRVRKVKIKETKHFKIWMDTKAAAKKFPKALEETYEAIRDMLALDEMQDPLPVYIFQNPMGYWDFCERHLGWSRASAENSAGHGSGRYFATYFQGNKAPTVTHELTHSMFHRVVGWGGGSWFQEGAAVYCEDLHNKRSAAKTFSTKVRGERFMPLRKFITTARLIDSEDARGGAETSDALYAQAGALFEFLLRSEALRTEAERKQAKDGEPFLCEKLKRIAKLKEDGEKLATAVQNVIGMSIEDLQEAWLAWGSKPPKSKTR